MNYHDIHLSFDVVVRIPKPLEGRNSVNIKKFETAMPLFSHTVDDLASTVVFDFISLKTVNAPISVTVIPSILGKAVYQLTSP